MSYNINDLETSLNEYDTDLIKLAEKYEEQLQKISNDKVDSYQKVYDKLNASGENLLDLNLNNLRLENDEQYEKITKDDLILLKDMDEICQVYSCFQIYNYFNEKKLEQENNNLSSFKTNHNCYFWFYLHKELFLIGYLFRLIAYLMLKCSGDLESDYSHYQASFDKAKILQPKKKMLNQNEIISEDESKDLCNKIFGATSEKDDEINTSNKKFVINGNMDYSDLKNKLSEKMKSELSKLEKLIDIHEKRSKLKQLKAPYKIISALESQARILEANRPMISVLTSKLLDIPAEKIKGKSVDELLKTEDISLEQNKKLPEPPAIKTLYFSKKELFTISEEQKKNNVCQSGAFNTVFKHKGKILKPGKMHMICEKDDKSRVTEAGRLNCFKENSSVLVDTAVKGNIAYEVAKLFDLNCIVATSIAISDDNHISVMEDALKDGRVRYSDKECVYGAQAIRQINAELKKFSDNKYKLFCAASELNFLDVLLLQSDRHFGNFYYNANGIRGIDNDFIMPTKSSPIIKEINKHMGLFNNKLSFRPRNYQLNSIEQLAMMKIPIIPKELCEKIMSVSSENLRIVLNSFFIDDYQSREKVDFAIERFEEIKTLINDDIIKVIDKFDDSVISEILTQNALVECETFIATGRIQRCRSDLLDNMNGNLILRIMEECKSSPKKEFEKYIRDVDLHRHHALKDDIKKNKQFCSDWLDGLIANKNSKSQPKQQEYYKELKKQISEIKENIWRY